MTEQKTMGNLGASGVAEDTVLMKKTELYEAVKKIHEFCGAVLFRTSDVWMGKYMPPEILCSKCEATIPESEWLDCEYVQSLANEGFGNGAAIWTCPKCLGK